MEFKSEAFSKLAILQEITNPKQQINYVYFETIEICPNADGKSLNIFNLSRGI